MTHEFTQITVSDRESAAGLGADTAVSLHAHTFHSKEDLSFIPQYLVHIPIVSLLYRQAMKSHFRLHGKSPDFKRGYWIPPVSPAEVYVSECDRIRRRLSLQPLVSITDHDNIEAPVALKRRYLRRDIPISFEWTVPYGGRIFHIGVHNLPAPAAEGIARDLIQHRSCCRQDPLGALLDRINGFPETLVVLNHPFCDLVELGIKRQKALAVRFLNRYGASIHALEMNGYRSWRENHLSLRLAQKYAMPVVSGGDRHGRSPNAVLNLTRARTFADFVGEVRYAKTSRILIMPGYQRNLFVRELEAFGDFFRRARAGAVAGRRWKARVYYRMENGYERSLAYYWRRYIPGWVKILVWCASLTANRYIQTAVRMVLSDNEAVAV